MVCHFCAMSISCCLIKGSRVLPARSSHSRALARYSSALDVRTDLPVSTFRPLPAEIPAAHRIQVGSLPGPSLAMTGCSGYQPAQLTGENEPGLGGNEKPQLVSRFSSCLHSFLFCLSLALAARQHPPAPISSTDTHAKKPGNHGCRVSHRFCARLGEQACSRDHDPRDEYGHAGQQQYLVQNSGHRTLPLLRPPSLHDAGGFNAPQAYSTPPACSKGGAQVLGSCCCDCQAVVAPLYVCFCSASSNRTYPLASSANVDFRDGSVACCARSPASLARRR